MTKRRSQDVEPGSPAAVPPRATGDDAEITMVEPLREFEGAQPIAGDDDDDITNRIRVSAREERGSEERGSDEPSSDEEPTREFPVPGSLLPEGGGAVTGQTGAAEGGGAGASSEIPGEAALAPGGGDELLDDAAEVLPAVEGSRLESILESLLFAADRPLVLNELKRLLGERDGKRVSEALETLRARREEGGIQLVSVAGGWQLRTHPGNGAWVAKLIAGRPTRLSRAMMETLAIVAYRQPITRPEIDEIRGVDCGPVLRTLLDRALIRVIGKKEEVGRPMLYGTTPEFLKIFSLRDLADLPTLREFHELGAEDRAKVDASAARVDAGPAAAGLAGADVQSLRAGELSDVDPEEEDSLIEALERATNAAGRATQSAAEPDTAEAPPAPPSSEAGDR